MKTTATSLCLAILFAFPAFSQSITEDTGVSNALHLLDRWVDAKRAYDEIPGLSMAVVHGREIVWSKGFGYANVESQEPATEASIYSICSISKLFTSMGVMQLRDKSQLQLNDRVGEILPWFTIEQQFEDSAPITIEGLLTHSSGLPRESDFPYWSAPAFDFPGREQVIDKLSKQSTLYPASKYFQYSNLGLTLAGEIIGKVSGKPYKDYIQQQLLDPIGLTDTKPYLDLENPRMAKGYSAKTRKGTRAPVAAFQAKGIAPAAGFSSTATDLAKFAAWQLKVLEDGSDEVLDAHTLREMQRVHWMNPDWGTSWGLGFVVAQAGDETRVGHGGGCPGFRSQLSLYPESEIAIVVMANASGVDTRTFTSQAMRIMGPALKKAAEKAEEKLDKTKSFTAYIGKYSNFPWGGESEIIPWEDGIAMVDLPTNNPMGNLTKLKHIERHTFRRVRDDGALGEEITFELRDGSEAGAYWQHSNRYPRYEP